MQGKSYLHRYHTFVFSKIKKKGKEMALDDRCRHNVSDDDCFKCMKHGILLTCLPGCKDFEDVLTEEQREHLKKIYGYEE